ncbi:MAG: tetratricopeptide repeat protein [Nitrospirae bacterium]|nr:tetratricopeptide repeat protein [Nitrospirota bacterium]MBI3352392.1 tetratricopeptide repeat protein [Nitrospirota bacterium]
MKKIQLAVLILAASVFLYSGCAPLRHETPSPPLSFPPPAPPLSGEEGGSESETPRRMASLHLTEKGKSELEHGDLKKAMDRFEKAIGLDAQNSAAYYFFAEARFKQKEHYQSLTLLDRAEQMLNQQPDWLVKVYLLQGKNWEALGNKREAVKKYQKVLAIDPSQPEALERLK